MCFMDIQIGRKTERKFRSVTVGVAATQLVQDDPRRIGLILFAHNTARYTIGPDNAVAIDTGPTIQAAADPLPLSIQQFGQLVTAEMWAVASAAATKVGVVEILLPRDPQ